MKYMALMLFAFSIVFFAGCNAENPVCTQNFCFVGEAFPRSELETGQEFSEVDIDDSVIFATLITGTTPVETTAAVATTQPGTVSLADIVTDAATGGTQYVGQTVTIVAPVRFKLETAVSLFTNNESVDFLIKSPDAPNKLDTFEEGRTYQITVEITSISPPDEDFDAYAVYSDIDATKSPVVLAPENTSVKLIVDAAAAENKNFLGKTVSITGAVKFNFATPLAGFDPLPSVSLTTNNTNISFFITDHDEDTGVANMRRFISGNSYSFTVFIYSIAPSRSDPTDTNIFSQFVASN